MREKKRKMVRPVLYMAGDSGVSLSSNFFRVFSNVDHLLRYYYSSQTITTSGGTTGNSKYVLCMEETFSAEN